MHQLNTHTTDHNKISTTYTIPGNLIIFVRQSFIAVDNEWETVRIGMSVDEFLDLAEIIKTRKIENSKGIMPPKSEECDDRKGYGIWE